MFAAVFGSLVPFAVAAAAPDGQAIVLCSPEGPQPLDQDGDGRTDAGAGCAACILALAALPAALSADQIEPVLYAVTHPGWSAGQARLHPPARAPPRPPSTAPPR